MAFFPCSHCGERYRGPQQTIYPAIVNGGQAQRTKQRLCPSCMEDTQIWVGEHLVDVTGDVDEHTLCASCHRPDGDCAIFVTLYPNKAERQDWWGRVHSDCLTAARVALFGSSRAPEPI